MSVYVLDILLYTYVCACVHSQMQIDPDNERI